MVFFPPPHPRVCATRMKLSDLIFVLSVGFCAAQGSELEVTNEGEKNGNCSDSSPFCLFYVKLVFLLSPAAPGVNTSGCYNLTQILETWRSSIMAQVKDLLLDHHETVLPDYSR